jgi:hypothetical protein
MRTAPLIAALLLAGAPALAQTDTAPAPGSGIHVEAVSLNPGDTRAFTLAQGKSQRLLVSTDPAHPAPKAIVVTYQVAGADSVVSVMSRTGVPTTATVMADRRGDGGYTVAGKITTRGDGSTTIQRFPGALGRITVGQFDGG